MTQPQGNDSLVEALRAALAHLSTPVRAGQLRLGLEDNLGPEQSQVLRREIHQVIAAAEEHLPTRLVRVTPLTPPALSRLSAELAVSRGWTPATAERATRVWAAALGFDDLAAKDWPLPRESYPSRPDFSIDPELGVTALPPGTPNSAVTPGGASAPGATATAPWPAATKRLAVAHPQSGTGEPVLGVTQAYAGVSLAAFTIVMVILTVALVAVLLLLPGSGWLLALAGAVAARYATRFLQYGALLATETGMDFVPYDANMRRARPEETLRAPWSEVDVELGTVSTVSAAGRRFQVGPRNRAFAAAAAAVAGGEGR